MKLFLILLFTSFYFLGCGSNTDDRSSDKHSPIDAPEVIPETIYIITHATDDAENVFIYLDQPKTYEAQGRFYYSEYRAQPGECFNIAEDQFSKLIIKVGENWSTQLKTLCGDSDNNKCQPNNYNIVDTGDFLNDIYELKKVTDDNKTNCVDIATWMASKNPEAVAIEEAEDTEDVVATTDDDNSDEEAGEEDSNT